ncbi:hypothetical protein ACFQ9Y_16950 [Peribacillus simplex]|uniref:hypothetical protein n=1 Tax=Peribacillus simplex TaxID=1478 RepID=UPI003672F71C
MRKYLFIFTLLTLLTLLLVDKDASAQTKAKPTNEQLKAQITELEKEIDELKSVDDLKSDMQDSLLNREKDNSSKIYNASMWFIAVIGVLVAVGSIFIGLLINKLKTHQKELTEHQKELTAHQKELTAHQKKIDLVLDSKDFDMKVDAIEQRLFDMNLKAEEVEYNIIYQAKIQCKSLCKNIDNIIAGVHHVIQNNMIEHEVIKDIFSKHDWTSTTFTYDFKKNEFLEIQDTHTYDIVNLSAWFGNILESLDKASNEIFNQVNKNV